MKHHNPHTPIMVREALNTQPRVFARYEFGREKVEELGGESRAFLFCLERGHGCEHGGRLRLRAQRWRIRSGTFRRDGGKEEREHMRHERRRRNMTNRVVINRSG
jgi:hypothetical protein